LALYAGIFLVVTPGSFVEPVQFLRDVTFEVKHYAILGHSMNTVESGLPHLGRILDFLAFRGASEDPLISVSLFSLSIFGGYIVFRANKSAFFVLCAVPVIYVLFFSLQRVMNVRNLLVVLPSVFVLSAISVERIMSKLQAHLACQVGFLALVSLAACASINKFSVSTTSLENSQDWTVAVGKYLKQNPALNVGISIGALPFLDREQSQQTIEGNQGQRIDALIYVLGEFQAPVEAYLTPPYLGQLANRRNVYRVLAGPDEVDLDYYPNWSGRARLIVVNGSTATLLRRIFPASMGRIIFKHA
jgi:hypothetical protein